MNIALEKIGEYFSEPGMTVFASFGFEDRWSSLIKNLDTKNIEKIYLLDRISESADEYKDSLTGFDSLIEVISHKGFSPFENWKIIATRVIPVIEASNNPIVFDITTFNHELLLMLLAQIYEKSLFNKIRFSYVSACSYGADMTRGVSSIRSVLGFSGVSLPSKSFHHLVLLVGFELDRAKEMIISYEPTSISIGHGIDPYSDGFYIENVEYKNKLMEFIDSLGNKYRSISEFTFSCSDVESAKLSILGEVRKYNDSNIIVGPLNTKISTLAAGLAAIEDPTIKICYAEPLLYDKDNYSKAGSLVSVLNIR